MFEIERKFLVKSDAYKAAAHSHERVVQGYLSSQPGRTVRIRIKGEKGYITIKGASNEAGTKRIEWEKEIPLDEAELLLALCEEGAIEKTRYEVAVGQHTFEVDEFAGENAGLTVAEVELKDEDEAFTKPEWLGEEVTGDKRYYNSHLSKHPYRKW